MSKLTNRIIIIPPEVEVVVEKEKILVRGSLGKNELLINPAVEIIHTANKISTQSTANLALAGTFNSLIYNLIEGVSRGYKETLEVRGVGYKVAWKNDQLEFSLGKSHYDYVPIPAGLQVELTGNKIIITGIDKQKVRKFAANDIKVLCPPSIYKKNKGIYYLGEEKNIKLKVGKSLRK